MSEKHTYVTVVRYDDAQTSTHVNFVFNPLPPPARLAPLFEDSNVVAVTQAMLELFPPPNPVVFFNDRRNTLSRQAARGLVGAGVVAASVSAVAAASTFSSAAGIATATMVPRGVKTFRRTFQALEWTAGAAALAFTLADVISLAVTRPAPANAAVAAAAGGGAAERSLNGGRDRSNAAVQSQEVHSSLQRINRSYMPQVSGSW